MIPVMDSLAGVLILYNEPQPESDFPAKIGIESDAGVMEEVRAVGLALDKLGMPWRSAGVMNLRDLPNVITNGVEPLIFNLVEALGTDSLSMNNVPAVCEAMGRGCTGESASCFEITQNKWLCKQMLRSHDIPVPKAIVIPPGGKIDPSKISFHMAIIKPLQTDASEGIDSSSVITTNNIEEIANKVTKIHEIFHQPALIEQFIEGREINASMLREGDNVKIMPLAEIDFSAFPPDKPKIVDYTAKWIKDSFEYKNTPRKIPADLPKATADLIKDYAMTAWQAIGARDYIRVDFRLDKDLNPYILEINANPDISPDAGFAAALKAGRVSYERFVRILLENAWSRMETKRKFMRRSRKRIRQTETVDGIRWTRMEDRDSIHRIISETNFFRPEDETIAHEVLDDAITKGETGHYQSYTYLQNGKAIGWICFGPTPCTIGTYDLYWIVVAPSAQKQGIGSAMLSFAEQIMSEKSGRLVVVETSGGTKYESTRRFYEKRGYKETSRVPNFYAPGDDKIIYTKQLVS